MEPYESSSRLRNFAWPSRTLTVRRMWPPVSWADRYWCCGHVQRRTSGKYGEERIPPQRAEAQLRPGADTKLPEFLSGHQFRQVSPGDVVA